MSGKCWFHGDDTKSCMFVSGKFPCNMEAREKKSKKSTIEVKFKQVTNSEFNDFLGYYPNKLSSNVISICYPPIKTYRDETLPTDGELGDINYYFDKVVAKIYYSDDDSSNEYFIKDE